jgi:predicted transcriptional regulator
MDATAEIPEQKTTTTTATTNKADEILEKGLSLQFPDEQGTLRLKFLWEAHGVYRFRANWWVQTSKGRPIESYRIAKSLFCLVDINKPQDDMIKIVE